jgi:hypothetical protein
MELFTRATSAIPVSIGTSLALESIFSGTQKPYDPTRKIPQKVSLSIYQQCWINIETLIRNIASAVDRKTFMQASVDHILDILLSEIEIITSLFQIEGNRAVKPVFYFCTYASLRTRKKDGVLFRESVTPNQKDYDVKVHAVLRRLERMTDQIEKFDSEFVLPPGLRGQLQILIITHYPYDLTNFGFFNLFDLLESHTGILKSRKMWYTKFADFGQNDLSHIPFYEPMLFIFGDKSMIEPQSRKLRQAVYDLSIKERWTPYTEWNVMQQQFKRHITDPEHKQFLLGL